MWPLTRGGHAAVAAAAVPALSEDMGLAERLVRVRHAVATCDASDTAECVVYISKMFAVPKASLPDSELTLGTVRPLTVAPTREQAWWGLNVRAAADDNASGLQLQGINVKRSRRGRSTVGDVTSGSGSSDAARSALTYGDDVSDVETFIAFARVFSGVLRPGM
ncbi:hypothetical protein EON66_07875 [archaeon]|nr:MAG: hypothetical protein EON66_07875 [archaeon]